MFTPRAALVRSTECEARVSTGKIAAAEDQVLVRRFNEGDALAFDEIVKRHRDRIQALAGRFLQNNADAEEVAQDTFVRAYRGLAKFRGDSSLATWLHRIAVNLARNRYWYFFRRRKHMTMSLDCRLSADTRGTFADLVPSEEPDAPRQMATGEFVALAAACMNELDAPHRDILVLRNELHHSYDQIARALGTNEGTVKSRLARARGKLRGLMIGRCPEFSADDPTPDWFEPLRAGNSAGMRAAA